MIAYPLDVDGVLTRVLEAGMGDRAVLLIHGLGARADRWTCTLESLATDGFHAYALDLPGHGFAAKGSEFEYTVPSYTRFVAKFADALGHSTINLVGTSMGGHIAATMACARPETVRKLALVGSLGLVPMGVESRERIAIAIQKADPKTVEAKFRGLVFDPAQITSEWVMEESRINTSPGAQASFRALAAYLRNAIDEDVVGEQLGHLSSSVPTLLVWGADDNYVPLDVGKRAHDLLPKSRFAIISRCGHAPYLEQPTIFSQVLTAFLGDLPASSHDGLTYVSATSV